MEGMKTTYKESKELSSFLMDHIYKNEIHVDVALEAMFLTIAQCVVFQSKAYGRDVNEVKGTLHYNLEAMIDHISEVVVNVHFESDRLQ